jgi:maltokinase
VTSKDEWAALIGAANTSLVLPVRPRGASVAVPGPLRMVDALLLGEHSCVALVEDSASGRWVAPLVVVGTEVRRAQAGDGVATDLVGLLQEPLRTIGAFSKVRWAGRRVSGEQAVTVDQTNDSIIVGEAAVVKWTVRAPSIGEPGSPAAARMIALAYRHFDAMPEPWGIVMWSDGVDDIAIATVAAYLPMAQDGWDWAVREVGDYATGVTPSPPLEAAHHLGAIAANMHAALSNVGVETATSDQATAWRGRALADLDEALRTVDGQELIRLKLRAPHIRRVLDSLENGAGTPLIDIHGDFHVGQILRYGMPHRYAVTDFDGSPVLSPEERVAKQPAAVDVVSMLASLDHVGRVVVERVDRADAGRVKSWIAASQQSFLTTYAEVLGAERYGELIDESLFEPLRLQQELREFIYAARHLPHWKYVPDAALQDLLPDEE